MIGSCKFSFDCCLKRVCYLWIFKFVQIILYSRKTAFVAFRFKLKLKFHQYNFVVITNVSSLQGLVVALLMLGLTLPTMRIKSV